jgi:hypothetical protein
LEANLNDGFFYAGFRVGNDKDDLRTGVFISREEGHRPTDDEGESQQEAEKKYDANSFDQIQNAFFSEMHAFLDVLPMGVYLYPTIRKVWLTNFEKNEVDPLSLSKDEDEKWVVHKVADDQAAPVFKSFRRYKRIGEAVSIFPRLMLLGLVSQFDAYMGALLRIALNEKPHLIAGSNKSFPAHEVLKYTDIEAFKEAVVDKEIEGFLRSSHEEQFEYLARSFDVKLREGLDVWGEFIEACERRNLFAHSSGVVSEQYIIKCETAGFAVDAKRGDVLGVTPRYLEKKVGIFLEIGIKLAQVIARKIDPREEIITKQENVLNSISYDLISHEHYELASRLLDFACETMKKHPDDSIYSMMVVNRANAHKLSGRDGECMEILKSRDWSPFDAVYKISVASIRGDVDEVVELMPQLKDKKEFSKDDYKSWPVFIHVRDDEKFQRMYNDIYGEPYSVEIDGEGLKDKQEEAGGLSERKP